MSSFRWPAASPVRAASPRPGDGTFRLAYSTGAAAPMAAAPLTAAYPPPTASPVRQLGSGHARQWSTELPPRAVSARATPTRPSPQDEAAYDAVASGAVPSIIPVAALPPSRRSVSNPGSRSPTPPRRSQPFAPYPTAAQAQGPSYGPSYGPRSSDASFGAEAPPAAVEARPARAPSPSDAFRHSTTSAPASPAPRARPSAGHVPLSGPLSGPQPQHHAPHAGGYQDLRGRAAASRSGSRSSSAPLAPASRAAPQPGRHGAGPPVVQRRPTPRRVSNVAALLQADDDVPRSHMAPPQLAGVPAAYAGGRRGLLQPASAAAVKAEAAAARMAQEGPPPLDYRRRVEESALGQHDAMVQARTLKEELQGKDRELLALRRALLRAGGAQAVAAHDAQPLQPGAPPHTAGLPHHPVPLLLSRRIVQQHGYLDVLELGERSFTRQRWKRRYVVVDDRGVTTYRTQDDHAAMAYHRAKEFLPFTLCSAFVPRFTSAPTTAGPDGLLMTHEYADDPAMFHFGFVAKQPLGTAAAAANPVLLLRTPSEQEHEEWTHFAARVFNPEMYKRMFPLLFPDDPALREEGLLLDPEHASATPASDRSLGTAGSAQSDSSEQRRLRLEALEETPLPPASPPPDGALTAQRALMDDDGEDSVRPPREGAAEEEAEEGAEEDMPAADVASTGRRSTTLEPIAAPDAASSATSALVEVVEVRGASASEPGSPARGIGSTFTRTVGVNTAPVRVEPVFGDGSSQRSTPQRRMERSVSFSDPHSPHPLSPAQGASFERAAAWTSTTDLPAQVVVHVAAGGTVAVSPTAAGPAVSVVSTQGSAPASPAARPLPTAQPDSGKTPAESAASIARTISDAFGGPAPAPEASDPASVMADVDRGVAALDALNRATAAEAEVQQLRTAVSAKDALAVELQATCERLRRDMADAQLHSEALGHAYELGQQEVERLRGRLTDAQHPGSTALALTAGPGAAKGSVSPSAPSHAGASPPPRAAGVDDIDLLSPPPPYDSDDSATASFYGDDELPVTPPRDWVPAALRSVSKVREADFRCDDCRVLYRELRRTAEELDALAYAHHQSEERRADAVAAVADRAVQDLDALHRAHVAAQIADGGVVAASGADPVAMLQVVPAPPGTGGPLFSVECAVDPHRADLVATHTDGDGGDDSLGATAARGWRIADVCSGMDLLLSVAAAPSSARDDRMPMPSSLFLRTAAAPVDLLAAPSPSPDLAATKRAKAAAPPTGHTASSTAKRKPAAVPGSVPGRGSFSAGLLGSKGKGPSRGASPTAAKRRAHAYRGPSLETVDPRTARTKEQGMAEHRRRLSGTAAGLANLPHGVPVVPHAYVL